MTLDDTIESGRPVGRHAVVRVSGWVRANDPGLLAVKRSARAAIVMPLVFAVAHVVSANPQISLFGAFGSFALLLMVQFPGRPRTRLVSYLSLFLVGGGLIALGTAVSTHKVAAVVAMALVGFAVLYAGIVTPQAATGSTAALLTFVLSVAVAQPSSAVGPRLVGWALAGAACIPASMLLWPAPWHDDLRRRLFAAVSAVARVVEAHDDAPPDASAVEEMSTQRSLLRDHFAATPYPPTGAVAGAMALAKLVGRVEWVAGNAALLHNCEQSSSVRDVLAQVAETLRHSAALICDGTGHPVDDPGLIDDVQASARALGALLEAELALDVSKSIDVTTDTGEHTGGNSAGIASSLDPSFQARALGIATEMVADAALEAAGAPPASDHTLHADDRPNAHPLRHRLASHLSFGSVWFRNAVRGSAGLALAVGVAEVTDVQHGFWVVLGTLSVLRSNAVGTGASALRAIGGTAVGFIVGSAIMVGVADHTVLLWVLLPVAVLVSGVAPSMISFAAGQAGFTLVVIILFNIIDPVGWKVGLTRIEDVAIGCAVSVVVGFLFWPRGATAALGGGLSRAFVTSSGYLADAVDRLTATTRHVDTGPGERASHAAYLLLDDAFRQFLAEAGTKVVSVETVATLVTGSNRLRLAAYTLSTLPVTPLDPGTADLESVVIAGALLRDSYAASHRWYEEFAEVLIQRRSFLDPPPVHDETLHAVLRKAFEDAHAQQRGDRLRATLQMLWADELLDTQRQVQRDLAASADLFARRRRTGSFPPKLAMGRLSHRDVAQTNTGTKS